MTLFLVLFCHMDIPRLTVRRRLCRKIRIINQSHFLLVCIARMSLAEAPLSRVVAHSFPDFLSTITIAGSLYCIRCTSELPRLLVCCTDRVLSVPTNRLVTKNARVSVVRSVSTDGRDLWTPIAQHQHHENEPVLLLLSTLQIIEAQLGQIECREQWLPLQWHRYRVYRRSLVWLMIRNWKSVILPQLRQNQAYRI